MSRTHDPVPTGSRVVALLLVTVALALPAPARTDTATCLECHEYPHLETSVHGGLDCVDCHVQDGDFEDVPHFERYQRVDCAACHDDAVASYRENFHFAARNAGHRRSPDCLGCHASGGDPHHLHGIEESVAEESCRACHGTETGLYDEGVHAATPGASSDRPGCVSCHRSHGPGLPPSSGAVNALCESCHVGAMEAVQRGGHVDLGQQDGASLNCASCHDVHGTHKPHMSARVARNCTECHAVERHQFAGSVHADLITEGDMSCLSCHSTHKDEEAVGRFDGGCGTCHDDVEEAYRGSVHRFGRLRGNEGAATCADCHDGHHVLASEDPASPIHPHNLPEMCGHCHGEETVVTAAYVRLPITLPRYQESVHGEVDGNGDHAVTCIDCHGVHDLQHAQDPDSAINRAHLARTCGQCHEEESAEYMDSIHGQSLALGIHDAPTCNDCHDEHLTRRVLDPEAVTTPEHLARELCGVCHTDAELVSKYGITAGVVESYLDSYHGWAMEHGGGLVASCTDCHRTHEIRSPQDPASSIHQDNVAETCGHCHERSNETFARSYTHASALAARGPHEWARLIYIGLISVVLGGMALHNLIVARFELIRYRRRRRAEESVIRWKRAERMQHLVLLLSFAGLAITGFALRSPNVFWVKLIGLGGNELLRSNLHRVFAVILTAASLYHMVWIVLSRRGRMNLKAIVPKPRDFREFPQNMAFHLGLRRERPDFHRFDYTQKAEYWAVVWGTVVMALTGAILWFPDLVTGVLPAWVVRVAEVVHFYEAILAVSAIIIWHLFYVIFMPSEYPMSTIWLDGRMPAHEWRTMHPAEAAEADHDIGSNDEVAVRDEPDTADDNPAVM